jgi:glycosyltransferase involved in cell wall biosynthesis
MTARLDVLVVSSWYPAVDAPSAGRFVADQVGALEESGRVSPWVVSFDPAQRLGSMRLRRRQADALRRIADAGAAAFDPFTPGASGIPAVPTARLAVAGATRGSPHGEAIAERTAALRRSLGDRSVPPWRIVHAHTGVPDGAAAANLAGRLGLPLVITEHASYVARLLADPATRRAYLEAVAAARRVIAISRTLAEELRTAIPEIEKRLVVIPNVVAVDAFTAPPPSARRSGELVFVGTLRASKGISVLLAAVARARAERPGITLRLVGGAPDPVAAGRWRSEAARLGIAHAVTFEGEADRAGVAAALARASVFVHPSPRETFGVVAAEALAAGLPVVACDSGGVTEILGPEPDRLGALVPAGDAAALAWAIVRTLDRRDAYDSATLRSSVVERFGAASVAARIAALYEEVLVEASAAAPPRPGGARPPDAPSGEAARKRRGMGRPPLFVVGLDPDRAAAVLGGLSADGRVRIHLVTAEGASAMPVGLASVRRIVLGDRFDVRRRLVDSVGVGHVAPARLARAGLHLAGELAWRLPWRERQLVARATAGVEAARTDLPAGAALVCLDGLDYLAALPAVVAGGLVPTPGGARWLADHLGGPGGTPAEENA